MQNRQVVAFELVAVLEVDLHVDLILVGRLHLSRHAVDVRVEREVERYRAGDVGVGQRLLGLVLGARYTARDGSYSRRERSRVPADLQRYLIGTHFDLAVGRGHVVVLRVGRDIMPDHRAFGYLAILRVPALEVVLVGQVRGRRQRADDRSVVYLHGGYGRAVSAAECHRRGVVVRVDLVRPVGIGLRERAQRQHVNEHQHRKEGGQILLYLLHKSCLFFFVVICRNSGNSRVPALTGPRALRLPLSLRS